ncbi:S-layer homology domain-containing protein [Oscillibacter sp. MSJ-2]|uniref:S-layer homology domain-containing protein n=1 Tax=Dysosmobacter acutus TaxID=2841504 RepID=A0ABS6F7U9_9FIRM|nr:S-layer homology domain-containing protein [Dysosmobacter acutus]
MRNLKRMLSVLLCAVLSLSLAVPAFAAVEDTGFSDVAANDWYAEAAVYCRDNGVMNGTSATTFDPGTTMSRAMLATVLYRAAGSPAVSGGATFTDVPAGAYYADAAAWASANGIVSGYGNGLFGAGDPVTREQIATILWRYDGSEEVSASASFTDSTSIHSYATAAVNWAVANGIVTGMTDGRFTPTASATRAQVAVMLHRYLTRDTQETPEQPDVTPEEPAETGKVLVAYFSATGNTENIAQHLETILDADLYEIVPQEPYTSADLNYGNSSSRTSIEMNDPSARPAISGSMSNMEDYDVIFLGYPIWWGEAPRIISTFLESYDLSGKTIVPFCTSASSGIGSSATNLHSLADDANWLSGQRFSGSASQSSVESWVNGLGL